MKEIDLAELKAIEVEMLRDIHNYCQSNKIKYSLAFGTLLGAIRHKGFLPWDDDVDIMLPREDYDRFVKNYRHPHYKVVSLDTDSCYSLPFAKVQDTRTNIVENDEINGTTGIFIDIFPIDRINDSQEKIESFFKKKKKLDKIFTLKRVSVRHGRSFGKNLILIVSHILLLPFSARMIANKIVNTVKDYSQDSSRFAGVLIPTDCKRKSICDSKVFSEYTTVDFEGFQFFAIKDYDKYMKQWYGDYMKLPPIEHQRTHHSFKAWWK